MGRQTRSLPSCDLVIPATTLTYRNPEARKWRTEPAPGVLAFHRSLPGYEPTPLTSLPDLAEELGVARVLVKDESSRLGLPAFKILGASYAISRALSARLGEDRALDLDELRDRLGPLGPIELIAATDGNHGDAVAHIARLLGLPARIFTPSDITADAKSAIENQGARRVELAIPYDDVVAEAAAAASGETTLLIQDTSWDGYEQIPRWIVDGYGTLLEEADAQLADAGVDRLDLVAVPTGVGSLAQAVVGHYRSGPVAPSVLVVEPESAAAVLTSLHEGRRVSISTSPTIMAGLNCGTPTDIGWPTLQSGVDLAVAVTDAETTRAVHDLEGLGVDAGPCGAATLAAVRRLAASGDLVSDSNLLLLNTESRAANPLPDEST